MPTRPICSAPGETFSYSRYLIVGDGDVASVADTVHEILSEAVGTSPAACSSSHRWRRSPMPR